MFGIDIVSIRDFQKALEGGKKWEREERKIEKQG